MKKKLLTLTVMASLSLFSTEKNNLQNDLDPGVIYTSCGTAYEFDDTDMTWDDIFDLNELLDYVDCKY